MIMDVTRYLKPLQTYPVLPGGMNIMLGQQHTLLMLMHDLDVKAEVSGVLTNQVFTVLTISQLNVYLKRMAGVKVHAHVQEPPIGMR